MAVQLGWRPASWAEIEVYLVEDGKVWGEGSAPHSNSLLRNLYETLSSISSLSLTTISGG